MSLSGWLNAPGWRGRIWRVIYEGGYACLKSVVHFCFRPLFHLRHLGPEPRVPEGGVVLCANHASYLDPAFVQLVIRRRVTFVMTNDFYARPEGRWFFKLVGAVPVGRGRMARKGLRRAMALVRRGHAIVIFPEGRLSTDGEPTRAQRGIARLAHRTGVPIVPIGMLGNFRAWPVGARWLTRSDVRVKFGKPIYWSGGPEKPDRDAQQAFADELMAAIEGLRSRIRERAPSRHDPKPRSDS